MDKIEYVIDIIKTSLSFDKTLKTKQYSDLNKLNDLLRFHLQNLILSNETSGDDDILVMIELCKNLYSLNEKVSSMIDKTITHKNSSDKTLLFFYKPDCAPSQRFIPEWNKLLTKLQRDVKMVAVNCDDIKQQNVCKSFRIYQYPTIKYMSDGKVFDYHGDMISDQILDYFFG